MSMVVNNNLMAANTARNLNAHYGRLATSTQRLSSGLRINSAADDAAGLAIRELQRADIAALQQGARNANDAISMIQVADGALGIIDEKLIRMKELAEQAATGTYDSTQRLMIESEYQAMASEITRIANATDFNGMKLLDGTLDGEHDGSGLTATGKMKIHFGTGNDSAEDYYYITIGECTSQAFGLGNASTWEDVQSRAVDAFTKEFTQQIKNSGLNATDRGVIQDLLTDTDVNGNGILEDPDDKAGLMTQLQDYFTVATEPKNAFQLLKNQTLTNANGDEVAWDSTIEWAGNSDVLNRFLALDGDDDTAIDNFMNSLRTSEVQKLKYHFGQAAVANLNWVSDPDKDAFTNFQENINRVLDNQDLTIDETVLGHQEVEYKLNDFDPTALTTKDPQGLDDDYAAKKAYNIFQKAADAVSAKVGHMDAAGMTIETQEDAQMALNAINDAIVSKDKIRAHLGATQNRLENTVSNLNIQAENLQAAESRISDVDVATEMTQFVRNQILTQSAVAMLSQANSLPQMAMQLIGG